MKVGRAFLFLAFVFIAIASSLISDITANSVGAFAAQNGVSERGDVEKRVKVSELLSEIEHTTSCDGCQTLLIVLKTLAHMGNDDFVSVITGICKKAKVQDSDVCDGAIGLEGPILAHGLRKMTIGSKTAHLFCMTVFGLCQWPKVATYVVPMTPKPRTSRPVSSGKTPIQVVHISDIHIDLSYTAGANSKCTKNICCRIYNATDAINVTTHPAGPYGNHNCDSPPLLEESLYAAVKNITPDAAFTIFTGDVVEGAVWMVTQSEVEHDLKDAFGRMHSLGQTYSVVGNHDAVPVNSFPSADIKTSMSSTWVYDALSLAWAPTIGPEAAANVTDDYGSYSVKDAKTGVRIISINTNLWYKQNFWLYTRDMQADPSGQLAWLVKELEAAETAKERVWLMGHMPMGSTDAFHDQSQYFDQIIQRFDATISAVFNGHTHRDEFQIAYSNYTNQNFQTASMVGYIAPALTPSSGNPTFRVYSVDPETFGILDYSVYYANLSSPTYQDGPTWQRLYSVKESYGPLLPTPSTDPAAELTPAFWHNLTVLFETNDEAFQTFYHRQSRGYSNETCDSKCKAMEICSLRAMQSQYNCGTVKAGVHFKSKRDAGLDHGHGHARRGPDELVIPHGDCEGSSIAPIMSALGDEYLEDFKRALMDTMGDKFLNFDVE